MPDSTVKKYGEQDILHKKKHHCDMIHTKLLVMAGSRKIESITAQTLPEYLSGFAFYIV